MNPTLPDSMSDAPDVIPYETPTRTPKRRHPIVWWFAANGLLFFGTLLFAAGVYHDQPITYSAPPEVDTLLTVLLAASVVMFVALLIWGGVLMVRGRGR